MKPFLNIISILLISWLLIGCKTYRSIENVTVKNDANLTKIENLNRQLEKVSPQEKIQVKMENDRLYNLIYQSHSKDSLFTKIENISEINRNEKSTAPINLSLNEIDKIYIWRTNYAISIGVPSAALIGAVIYISVSDIAYFDFSGSSAN
jgi:hypothetical protein